MDLPNQNTDEWLEMRRNKVGASDAPIIMGVSPWKTPRQLWEEKLGMTKSEDPNFAMRRGTRMECDARQEFERMTGLSVAPRVMQHPTINFMIASLDGIDAYGKNLVEIKCPGKADHQCALDGEIPSKYIPQMQHQMEVAGLDSAFYFSFDGQSGKVIEVKRDEKYIERLVSREKQFWDCLQSFVAPDLLDDDYIQKEDEVWISASSSWLKCQQELKVLESQEEELRSQLIALSGKCNAKGGGISLCRFFRKGSIDYKSVPELKGIDLEQYRKSSVESWRLSECA